MRQLLAIGLLAGSCLLARAADLAGGTVEPSRQRGAEVNVDHAARTLPQRERIKHVLRCWQDGHLIVERRMDNLPKTSKHTFELGPVDKKASQIFDLRNSTCLIE